MSYSFFSSHVSSLSTAMLPLMLEKENSLLQFSAKRRWKDAWHTDRPCTPCGGFLALSYISQHDLASRRNRKWEVLPARHNSVLCCELLHLCCFSTEDGSQLWFQEEVIGPIAQQRERENFSCCSAKKKKSKPSMMWAWRYTLKLHMLCGSRWVGMLTTPKHKIKIKQLN